MAGFHPAAGRIINVEDGAAGDRTRPDVAIATNDADADVVDEIESDFSSDYDQPYHETASNWYNRNARRVARRMAGISSSSSSSSSDCSSVESEDDGFKRDSNDNDRQGGDKKKAMEKAMRSATRPLKKWLSSYPLVAARCCLSPIHSTTGMDTNNNFYGVPQFNHSGFSSTTSTLISPREQETKRIRRILRRLRRKQKEFHVKFPNNKTVPLSSSPGQRHSSYYQSTNALSLEQMMRINQETAETENDRYAIHSFIPQGTGISFIDEVLSRDSLLRSKPAQDSDKQQKTQSRLVLELNGPSRSGMTSILLAVAARYVASTCSIFLEAGCAVDSQGHSDSTFTNPSAGDAEQLSGECPRPAKRRKQRDFSPPSVTEPRVVILDLEKGVHAVKLVLSVREAVLRRWDETSAARQWKREQEKLWNLDEIQSDCNEATDDCDGEQQMNNTMDERHQIDLAIASCLGRIHVVQPRDFTYLSLVATIEVLRQSLDKEKVPKNPSVGLPKQPQPQPQFGHQKKNIKPSSVNATSAQQEEAPTLILIDSLTTLDASTRFLESLPTNSGNNRSSGGSGLSDRNEFYRQLIRLRDEHEVAIFAACRCATGDQSFRGGAKCGSLWDKMVSHRIALHHVAEGTQEDREGHDFVATLNTSGTHEGASVFPYSVTAGGIAC